MFRSSQASRGIIAWAEHIVFVFPLWLGTMPALLKAFLEQVMRPGIAFAYPDEKCGFNKTLLQGRSARIVVTMGMPSFFYRLWFLGHGIAGMRRNILNFVGIKPVRETCLARSPRVVPTNAHNGSSGCKSWASKPARRRRLRSGHKNSGTGQPPCAEVIQGLVGLV